MQYRIFVSADASDQLCYQVKYENTVIIEDKSISNYRIRLQWIFNVLASNDIFIAQKTYPKTSDFLPDGSETNVQGIDLPPSKTSKDGNSYYLVQDTELNLGWALVIKSKPDGSREVIAQDHRDGVLDWLLQGDWIRSFGIDYKQEAIADQSFWRNR